MATLTGTTIQSTYDSLLKVTDNDSITGSLKRITDGLGNNTPLYLSSSAVEIVSALNVIGNITGTNLSGTNTGDETKASIESKLGAATSSNSGYLTSTDWSTFNNKIAGSGTLNKLAKFSSSSSIADSTITDTGSAVTIGVATTVSGTITSSGFIKTGGSPFEFLKADGTVDTNSYVTFGRTITINGTTQDLSANRTFNVGTVTSVSGTGTVSGLTLTGTVTSSGSLTLGGSLTLTSGQITSGLGYTPVPNTRTLTINGTSYDLSADRSWTISTGISGSGTTNYIPKFTGSTSLGNSLIFDNGTNVGIGTTNAIDRLTVSGRVNILGNNQNSIWFNQNAGGSSTGYIVGRSLATNDAQDFFIYDVAAAAFRLNITSGGNVGIGTSSPNTQLHVVGSLTVNDIVYLQRSSSSLFLPIANYWNGSGSPLAGTKGDILAIGNAGGDGLALVNSNAVRMFINSSGNVGIGTSSPNQLLSVGNLGSTADSTILIGSSTTSTGNLFFGDGTGINVYRGYLQYNHNDDSLAIGTSSTERMRITSGGNVGIGTSSPARKLTVSVSQAAGGEDGLFITDNLSNNVLIGRTGTSYNYIGIPASCGLVYSNTTLALAADGNPILFSAGGLERMRITSAGNVGIGTSSPGSALDVRGVITGGNGTIQTVISYLSDAGVVGTLSNHHLSLYANFAERMRITSAGNVGIGTSSPSTTLQVNGIATSTLMSAPEFFNNTGYPGNSVFGSGTDATTTTLRAGSSSGFQSAIFLEGGNVSNTIRFNTASAERMRIFSGGNIAIGSSTDNNTGAKLQVTGGMTYQNLFNRRTASYTLTINDQNYIVEMNVGSANNLTIPPNSTAAFPIGTEIAIIQYGAGQTTIVAGAGVTLRSKSNALKISGRYAGCTCVKVGTDEWYVIGDLTL